MKKHTYIVSKLTSYEFIYTEEAYCKLQLLITYALKGHTVWNYPMWFAAFVAKFFNKGILRDVTITVERFVPGSDQVTYYSPYHN